MSFQGKDAKIVVIIQARMGSSRLPGKVLKDIGGLPMLGWMLVRTRQSEYVDEVWVATTDDPSDDAVAAYCQQNQASCFRGSVFDVLDRFYQAAKTACADLIVRLTGDCPFMDPKVIDDTIRGFYETRADFCATRLPPPFHRTYPIGLDVEVVSFKGLERAWREATTKFEREHVMPFFYDAPERFKVTLLHHSTDLGHYRWTVDTPEDLELLRTIADAFDGKRDFSWLDVLAVYDAHPEWQAINEQIQHKTFMDVDHRMTQSTEGEKN